MSDFLRAAILAAMAFFAVGAMAQQEPAAVDPAPASVPKPPAADFSRVEIKVLDLGHKTYMLEGQGGNITIAVAANNFFLAAYE